MVISCYSCFSNNTTEKYHNKRDNIVNVHEKIREIPIEEIFIGYYSWPMIIGNYMFIIDYKTANEFIHIFNKSDFKYITSTAFKGQGPGEIANIGFVAEDKMSHKFYVSDHGKNRIFTYDMDSVISDPAYLPTEKMIMGDQVFPTDYIYVNDTLSIGMTIQRLGNGNFNPIVAKFNMETGEINPMEYTIHPMVKKKRVSFAISMEHGVYVEVYAPHDLITMCDLNGKLKYNIYGTEWNTETHGINYYGPVLFCNNRIVVLYSGNKSITKDRKTIFPTKIVIFDLDGNYLKTLETNYPIINFCYDKDNDRIIMSIDDEIQFAYLDVGTLLD